MQKKRYCRLIILILLLRLFSGFPGPVQAEEATTLWNKVGQEVNEATGVVQETGGAVSNAATAASREAWENTREGSTQI